MDSEIVPRIQANSSIEFTKIRQNPCLCRMALSISFEIRYTISQSLKNFLLAILYANSASLSRQNTGHRAPKIRTSRRPYLRWHTRTHTHTHTHTLSLSFTHSHTHTYCTYEQPRMEPRKKTSEKNQRRESE